MLSKSQIKELVIIIIITLTSLSCAGKKYYAPDSREISGSLHEKITEAIAKVKPALVRIHVVFVEYDDGREEKHEASGSGVIISKNGFAVTNHHVAGKAKRIVCTMSNREEVEAELIGTDALTDISVIKLKSEKMKEFPTASFGDSLKVKVGDNCLAMGSPLALSQSVTLGIISNTEMVMPQLFWPFNRFTLDGEDVGTLIKWIGHDAAIYGGNSGGPLVNLDGEIIGINEIGFGLSGAIPGNIARESAEKIIQSSEIERSWIGLNVQPLLKSSSVKKGLLVSSTIKDSPAEKAGLLPGDILVKLAGAEVSANSVEELPAFNKLIANLPVGSKIDSVVLRDGKENIFSMSTIKRENAQLKKYELKEWGMTANNISLLTAKELKRESRDGVIVNNTRQGGPCGEAKPGIQSQDIITGIGDTPIKNIDELLKITSDIVKDKTEPVPVKVSFERKSEEFVTVVKLGIKNLEDPGREARKAWLPAKFQAVTKDIAKIMDLNKYNAGVRVTMVYPKSSAEKAGLMTGDIIVFLDKEPVTANQPEDVETFENLIRQYKIGSIVKLNILRGKEEKEIEVELVPSPKLDREMKKYQDNNFEFAARDITFFDQVQEKWEEKQNGVLVTGVSEGGWARLSYMAVNDLIVSINGEKIKDVFELKNVMQKISQDKPKYVVFQVLRDISYNFIETEPDWGKK
ncbi:MAG: PDZ domain-containing protein [bacterium]|nr:PDZ domain-containing protein [bacterium]